MQLRHFCVRALTITVRMQFRARNECKLRVVGYLGGAKIQLFFSSPLLILEEFNTQINHAVRAKTLTNHE